MTTRTARRRLEKAGYVSVRVGAIEGHVHMSFAARIAKQIDFYLPEVDRILAERPKPRGRPRKEPR